MFIELREDSRSPHGVDESIGREEKYSESTISHMQSRYELRTMSRDYPEEEREHRYSEVEGFYSVHPSKSIAKCQYDDDELRHSECEREHDRRSTPELVARYQYTDSRDLIEEPADDIGLCLSAYDRVDIAEHRCID